MTLANVDVSVYCDARVCMCVNARCCCSVAAAAVIHTKKTTI